MILCVCSPTCSLHLLSCFQLFYCFSCSLYIVSQLLSHYSELNKDSFIFTHYYREGNHQSAIMS